MNLIDNHQRRISSSYYTSSNRFRYDSIYPIFSSQDKMSNYRPVSMDDDSSESNSSSTNELAGESITLLNQLPCECLSHHDRIRLLLSYLPLPPVATNLIWKLARLPNNGALIFLSPLFKSPHHLYLPNKTSRETLTKLLNRNLSSSSTQRHPQTPPRTQSLGLRKS